VPRSPDEPNADPVFEILWSPAAEWALRAMPWRDAAKVDAAVQEFARNGTGDVFRVYAHDPRSLRLKVSTYLVRMTLDPETLTLTVILVFRTA